VSEAFDNPKLAAMLISTRMPVRLPREEKTPTTIELRNSWRLADIKQKTVHPDVSEMGDGGTRNCPDYREAEE